MRRAIRKLSKASHCATIPYDTVKSDGLPPYTKPLAVALRLRPPRNSDQAQRIGTYSVASEGLTPLISMSTCAHLVLLRYIFIFLHYTRPTISATRTIRVLRPPQRTGTTVYANVHTGNRTQVTSMGGLYDAPKLCVLVTLAMPPLVLRPARLLRVWIPEGLAHTNSWF